MSYKQIKREYAHWRALDRRTKIALGLPLSDKDFAQDKGVGARTLRDWKKDPDFVELEQQIKVANAKAAPNSTVSADAVGTARPVTHGASKGKVTPPRPATPADDPYADPSLSIDERNYLQTKDTIWSMARGGDKTALDLAMKYWGQQFVDAERAGDESLFTDMSEDELIVELIAVAGVERVAELLADTAVS